MPQRRTQAATRAGAPLWVVSYADLMSLLVVLFVFIYSASQPSAETREDAPEARSRESSGWMYLGRLQAATHDGLAGMRQRLLGGRSRIALVGFGPAHEAAFEAARAARDLLLREGIEEERCLLVSGGPPPTAPQQKWVEVYATRGVVGPAAGR